MIGFVFLSALKGGPAFRYLAAYTSTLNILCSGMHYAWPSPSLPQLLGNGTQIPMTGDQGSWVAVIPLIGGMCGALVAGITLDRFGRKKVIVFISLLFFIAWIMVAFARSLRILLLARYIAGLADGMSFCAIPMYLAEISDPKIRGLLGCSVPVIHMFGMLLINIIGSYLSIKTAALISSVIPIILILTFIWMPESPYYLIMKGNSEPARQSLKLFKGSEDVEQELKRLTKAVEEQNASTGKYLDLFTVKSNRRAVYAIMGARGFQQLCGIMAINFYTQTTFKEAGSSISPVTATIIYFVVQLIFSSISSMVVDKTGRRPLMIVSITGSTFALLIEAFYFYVKNETDVDTINYTLIPIIALIVFVILFNVGMQTIPILLLGELFPTNVKAFALTYADIYYCIVTTIVSKFFQFTKDEIGLHVPFFTFAVCGVLGLLFIIFYIPETKGKTFEDIQQELKGETVNNTLPKSPENFVMVDSV